MPPRLGGSKFLLVQRKVNVHKPAPLSYTNITDDSLLRRECSGSLMLTLCNVSVVVHVGYADLMRAPTHRNVTSFFPHRAVKKNYFSHRRPRGECRTRIRYERFLRPSYVAQPSTL